ncbi:MAG: hypothetical protein ACLP9K_04315 [Nitrososphaerales archaeon]
MESDVVDAVKKSPVKIPADLNPKTPVAVKKDWARKLIASVPVTRETLTAINKGIAISTFLKPGQVASMRMSEEGVTKPPTSHKEEQQSEEQTTEKSSTEATQATQTKDDVDAKIAAVKAEITKTVEAALGKFQATLEQVLTRPPGAETGTPTAESVQLVDMPGNNMTVAISPMTQVYYAVATQKVKEMYPNHETGSLAEFINDCVRFWFEAHGFTIGIFDSNRKRLEFRRPSS